MLQLRSSPQSRSRRATASAVARSYPAPVNGWNARDPIAKMKAEEAILLDNLIPQAGYLELRGGHAVHATGIGSSAVETLIPFASGTTSRLLACGNSAIYNATSAGAVGAALASGLTNNRWQWVNFKAFAVLVNGADTPRTYDGTTVATTSITGTGLTATNLIHVNEFKSRLFFVEKDTLNVWYLATNAISGAATKLDFSTYCKLGGTMMAMATWTRDGGTGADDHAVFITSAGEVIIFQGEDPGDATNWGLVGVFKIGAPIGRRCFESIGSDLAIVTEDGFVPLAQVLPFDRSNPRMALSDRISSAVNLAVLSYRTNFGWQPILYPRGHLGIFNIPITENTTAHQYVINTITGAWCRFTGWNANCFAVYQNRLYFGGTDGKVYLADEGRDDNGSDIMGDAKQAFTYFGLPGMLKKFSMVRPTLTSDGVPTPAVEINVDFAERAPSASPTTIGGGGSPWDDSPWDTSPWGAETDVQQAWITVGGIGYAASIRMRIATDAAIIRWMQTTWLFEPAGLI